MSSFLTQIVPVLTGQNWIEWQDKMEAYLMSTGGWSYIRDGDPTEVILATNKDGDVTNQAEFDDWLAKHHDWKDENLKAMGSIRLRLSPACGQMI